MSPYISVVIRLYNGIEYLNESVDSVIQQDYNDWELIVGVNGHGPDGNTVHREAEAVVGAKGDSRLRVVNFPEVKGGAMALNALASAAKADWVAILDVDDKWHASKLSHQVLWMEGLQQVPDVIGTHCQYIGEMSGGPSLPSWYIDKSIFREFNPMINSSVIVRKSLVDFTDQFYGLDDYDLWCRLSIQDHVFFNVPEVLTYHRIRRDSQYNWSKKQDPDALRKHYYN